MNEIILSVVHTFQDEEGVEHVRIISARKATKAEQQLYRQRCPR
nr:MAG: Ribonuclease toxin, BrnT, of type II toxin-antitoxin system [Candidatus Kentron sp. H]